MGAIATELKQLLPGVFQWAAFSPEHKVELASHAVLIRDQLYVFDPIELISSALDELTGRGNVAAIVLTNENHERAADLWHEQTGAAIWFSAEVKTTFKGVRHWQPDLRQWMDWELIPLPGGPAGETALFWRERSLMVLGDAVFNLPQYGFDVLPEKYCSDHDRLRAALAKLAEMDFQTALLAHGEPLLQNASQQISSLLG